MDEIWNTKVFVDKLPKSCNDCVVDHCGEWCCLNGVEIDTWSYNETRPKECPLQTLAEYTKQVRKEVCEDIKSEIIKHHEWKYEDCYTNSDVIECVLDVIEEFLDQIKGE